MVYREKLCKVHSLSEDDVKHKHHLHSVHLIHLFKLTLILYVSAFVYVIYKFPLQTAGFVTRGGLDLIEEC